MKFPEKVPELLVKAQSTEGKGGTNRRPPRNGRKAQTTTQWTVKGEMNSGRGVLRAGRRTEPTTHSGPANPWGSHQTDDDQGNPRGSPNAAAFSENDPANLWKGLQEGGDSQQNAFTKTDLAKRGIEDHSLSETIDFAACMEEGMGSDRRLQSDGGALMLWGLTWLWLVMLSGKFRKEDDQICAGLGTSERDSDASQCLSTRDFTQEDKLEGHHRQSRGDPEHALHSVFNVAKAELHDGWTLMLSCLRICCRQSPVCGVIAASGQRDAGIDVEGSGEQGKGLLAASLEFLTWADQQTNWRLSFSHPVDITAFVIRTTVAVGVVLLAVLVPESTEMVTAAATATIACNSKFMKGLFHLPTHGRGPWLCGLRVPGGRGSGTFLWVDWCLSAKKGEQDVNVEVWVAVSDLSTAVPEMDCFETGVKVVLDKMIVPALLSSCDILKNVLQNILQQTLRMQDQLLAEADVFRFIATFMAQAFCAEFELFSMDACFSVLRVCNPSQGSVARPGEHPKRALPAERSAVIVQWTSATTERWERRRTHRCHQRSDLPQSLGQIGRSLEDAEMPVILTPLAPPPSHPPKLSGAAEPSAEVQCEEAQDKESVFNCTSCWEVGGMLEAGGQEEPRRPPPPDMPPPPCPAGQEILRWLQQPPKGETAMPVVADMGCFSGGTGGTPGWDGEIIQSCDQEDGDYDGLDDAHVDDTHWWVLKLLLLHLNLQGPAPSNSWKMLSAKSTLPGLDASLQREREELAIRHHEILQELHQLVQRNELLKSEATNRWTPDVTDKLPADSVDAVKLTEMDLAQVQRTKSDEPSSVGRKMAEFHVIRVQGQTKVLRDPVSVEDTDVKRREHASRFERMGSASSGVLKAEAPKGIFKFVFDPMFETVICVLIVINSIVMSFEAQHAGLTLGYDLGIRTYNAPGTELWPGAAEVFVASEWFFGPIFAAELILKIIGMKCEFLRDFWNYFDTIMVVAWFVDTVFAGLLPVDPMLLRLARLARLLRLMRLVRKLKGFDALYILTTALRGSVTVLLWSFLMLFLLQLMFALFLQRVVSDSIESNIASQVMVAESNELFLYFGTCSRCLLTMFEITLGNWPPVARLLQDHVSEAFTAFSIIHKITIGYALIAVINGVFLKETFQAADNDDKIMMRNTEKKRHQHIKKMKSLFEAADETGDGVLDREEFIQVMTDPEIVNWLAAMDLHISDPNMVFDMVQEDGGITAEQLVKGVSRLKGSARSTDLHLLTLDVKKLFFLVQDLCLGPCCMMTPFELFGLWLLVTSPP
ncbi:para [Symbiodinium sp. CCMP2592]|nr:para [Symbiodinium sp. CCMP2592]